MCQTPSHFYLVSGVGIFFEAHVHRCWDLACVWTSLIFLLLILYEKQSSRDVYKSLQVYFSPLFMWHSKQYHCHPYCYLLFCVYTFFEEKESATQGWIIMNSQFTYRIRWQYHSLPADATTWSMMYTRQEKGKLKSKYPDTLRKISVLVGSLTEGT